MEEVRQIVAGFESAGINPHVYKEFDGNTVTSALKDIVERDGSISAMIVIANSHGLNGDVDDRSHKLIPVADLVAAVCSEKLGETPKVNESSVSKKIAHLNLSF